MNPIHLPLTPAWLYWAHPWMLLSALLIPLLWLLWLRRDRRPVIRFSSLNAVRSAGGAVSRRMRLILPILRTLALLCLIVAAARPQRPDETSSIYAEGVAIQMVVDTSGSMRDLDLAPRGSSLNRLEIVKRVFRMFVEGDESIGLEGRPNDLIGMIRFARYADSVCPLTLDHDNLLEVLRQTDIVRTQTEDGTAIGDGLALAVERLKELKRTTGSGEQLKIVSRVVILLTDGENNFGMLEPEQAGELAATYGIKVYTILAGTGQNVGFGHRLKVDDTQLQKIADVTGGRHFHARNASALVQIYGAIDELERTHTEERTYLRWGELAGPSLVLAFFLLGVQTLLEATRMRKIP